MKAKLPFIYLFLTCQFLQPAISGTTYYTSFGAVDCGEWVNQSKQSPATRTWLLGYMSGLAGMHNLNDHLDNPLQKINSAQQIYVWMDNYCQKNPLKRVSDGGIDLFIELMKLPE